MEAVIARLLAAFEQGKMNRRQLVQSLAVAAAGGRALAAPSPVGASTKPAAPRAVLETAGLDHISYAVSDYGRSRDFYSELMGWKVLNDDGERQATLQIGDVGLIIIRNNRGAPPPQSGREGRPPLTGVINHVSWRLSRFETEEVRAELERRGLNPRRDQGGGPEYDSYHVLDPDGWDLQISNQTPDMS
jgi:catechol 2,3-dioxygenase-like lactoylglutathione lyase family enzyme